MSLSMIFKGEILEDKRDKLEKRVLVGIDDSEVSLKVAGYVAKMFVRDPMFNASLIYVLPALPTVLFEEEHKLDKYQRAYKKKLESKYQGQVEEIFRKVKKVFLKVGWAEGRLETITAPRHFSLSKELLFFAEHGYYDALALGWQDMSGIERIFKSSTGEEVLYSPKNVPLWLIADDLISSSVLVAIDGSESAMRAVDHAGFVLSGRKDIEFILFHVVSGQEEAASIFNRAESILTKAGIPKSQIKKVAYQGKNIAEAILAYKKANQISTVIMGRRGISKMKALFWGSVSSKVLKETKGGAVWIVD